MTVTGTISPGASRSASFQVELSKKAGQRLKWSDYHNPHGQNARLTCRYFGISLQTFYRLKKSYNPHRLGSLKDCLRYPNHLRQLTVPLHPVAAV